MQFYNFTILLFYCFEEFVESQHFLVFTGGIKIQILQTEVIFGVGWVLVRCVINLFYRYMGGIKTQTELNVILYFDWRYQNTDSIYSIN